MRYSPNGKYKTTLWVNAQGGWHLGDAPIYRNRYQHVVIEISDILTDDEVRGMIHATIMDAPRVGDYIVFSAWRWWQECLKENEETS